MPEVSVEQQRHSVNTGFCQAVSEASQPLLGSTEMHWAGCIGNTFVSVSSKCLVISKSPDDYPR